MTGEFAEALRGLEWLDVSDLDAAGAARRIIVQPAPALTREIALRGRFSPEVRCSMLRNIVAAEVRRR